MKNDFCKIIFHPQTPLGLNAKKLLLHGSTIQCTLERETDNLKICWFKNFSILISHSLKTSSMRYFIFIFLLFLNLNTFSQTVSEESHIAADFPRQVGFDVTNLLSQFLNFSSSSSFNNPDYFISFKKLKNDKINRMGLGLAFEIEGQGAGTSSDVLVNFRAGREKQINFMNRWRFSYGFDFKTNFSYRNIGNTDVSRTQLGLGGAPIFGLEFFINPRLSLSTEAAYNVFFVVNNQDGETDLGGIGTMSLPRSLVVNFSF
jgi:hypothetical protein